MKAHRSSIQAPTAVAREEWSSDNPGRHLIREVDSPPGELLFLELRKILAARVACWRRLALLMSAASTARLEIIRCPMDGDVLVGTYSSVEKIYSSLKRRPVGRRRIKARSRDGAYRSKKTEPGALANGGGDVETNTAHETEGKDGRTKNTISTCNAFIPIEINAKYCNIEQSCNPRNYHTIMQKLQITCTKKINFGANTWMKESNGLAYQDRSGHSEGPQASAAWEQGAPSLLQGGASACLLIWRAEAGPVGAEGSGWEECRAGGREELLAGPRRQ